MASTKIKDLVVKVGSYTDRNTGQEKNRWETIGAIMQSDDGSMFVMLKRTFNPAGVPGQDARESILVSAFDPNRNNSAGDRQERQDAGGGYDAPPSGGAPMGGMDDEVPFAQQVL